MIENTLHTSNVLPFKRPVKRSFPDTTPAFELGKLLVIYDQLIGLLRETYDEGLDYFTDGLVGMVVRCREGLSNGMCDEDAEKMLKEMRDELHHFPRNLRAILPGIGPRLGESLEYKLGVQFAKF
ncbi:MAG: hypothetical protein REI95_11980 [Oxalicibacterium faecigallinarum]|uniref:hypothetical protein n=1 Tax=Oxalicibacterium faecigallinarum TaxID=573741 RepID=UPI002808D653|nr:hypothetical protein [Oxalicibacterium faecigallinarum]MDQ7970353.1 hypothetical protein [Oxalicibacterium faecigallinarum]